MTWGRRAAMFPGRRHRPADLRHNPGRAHESVLYAIGGAVRPDDGAGRVNPEHLCVDPARDVHRNKWAATQQESVHLSDRCRETGLSETLDVATQIVSHNLAHVVDAPSLRVDRARNVEGSEPTAAQQKAMIHARGTKIHADDVASVVDAGGPGVDGAGEIKRRGTREIARIHEEPVLTVIVREEADDVAARQADAEGCGPHRTRGIEARVSPSPQ